MLSREQLVARLERQPYGTRVLDRSDSTWTKSPDGLWNHMTDDWEEYHYTSAQLSGYAPLYLIPTSDMQQGVV